MGPTDEDEGLEAQAIPNHQGQVGNRGRKESGSFLEGHATQSSKLPVDPAFSRPCDHQPPCPGRLGACLNGLLAAAPSANLTAFSAFLM
jgi:hypothetical protein